MWSSLEGLVIAGRYELREHIATGGMAVVFKGWDHRVQRAVAIKMLRQLEQADCSAVSRFRREAHTVAMLNHPNVVRAYDFFEEEGCAYLVMEFVEGINLKQRLRQYGPMPQAEALRVAEQVCAALGAAHAHCFIHRDIKPQNILLEPCGTAKVADFGIVHITRGSTLTSDGTVLGTADYIAPEQARGETLTPATDVYALGVVLYELLTGQLPFTGPTPMAVATLHATEPVPPPSLVTPAISPYVEAVVLRALHKQPGRRYQSAAAFAQALRLAREKVCLAGADGHAVHARQPSGPLGATARTPVPAVAERGGEASEQIEQGEPAGSASGGTPSPVREAERVPVGAAVADSGASWRDVAALLLASGADGAEGAQDMEGEVAAGVLAGTPVAMAASAGTHASWLRLVFVALTSLALLGGTLGLELWLNVHSAGMGLLPLP